MRSFAVVLTLIFLSQLAQAEEESRFLVGRVVDPKGDPVAGARVGTFWNANGISWEAIKRLQESPGEEIEWRQGDMEPWGIAPARTDAEGQFTVEAHDADYKLMALDAERRQGGIGMADPQHPDAPIEIVLRPLIKVHGKLRVDGRDDLPDWTGAEISLPLHEHFPLGRDKLAYCGSDHSLFAFLLPPGRYRLHAYNDPSEENGARQIETVPDIVFNLVEDQRDVDLGDVVLTLSPTVAELAADSKTRGAWGDYTKRYGQPAPDWHVHDARGVPKQTQPRDFRGKWLVIYFWGPYCSPCLKRGLPALMDFSKQHAEKRDRFEIVAFCLDKDAGMNSIGDIDRHLKPVIENVWGGKSLDFPVLLDNSFQTFERYGLTSVGHLLLVDPQGNLQKGDLATLAETLSMQK